MPATKRTIHTDCCDLFLTIDLFQVAQSSADVDLRIAGGPYIYKGFAIKGRVNILGWEIYAHVKLSETVRETLGLI